VFDKKKGGLRGDNKKKEKREREKSEKKRGGGLKLLLSLSHPDQLIGTRQGEEVITNAGYIQEGQGGMNVREKTTLWLLAEGGKRND